MKSIETLDAAERDVKGEEDNPEVKNLRHAAFEHIKKARAAADRAHAAWLKDVKK